MNECTRMSTRDETAPVPPMIEAKTAGSKVAPGVARVSQCRDSAGLRLAQPRAGVSTGLCSLDQRSAEPMWPCCEPLFIVARGLAFCYLA